MTRFFSALTVFWSLGLSSLSYAQEPVSEEEKGAAALIYLCEMRAKKLGLTRDLELWDGFRQDYVSDEAYASVVRGIDAVQDIAATIDSDILTQRCDEGMTLFTADVDDLPDIDPAIEAMNAELSAQVDKLNEELKVSGYGPDDQKIMLDHFVALSNHHGLDNIKKAGAEGIYAYKFAIQAVREQREAFKHVLASNESGKALLLASDICIGRGSKKSFDDPHISDEQASSAAVRRLIVRGIKYHRQSLTGGNSDQTSSGTKLGDSSLPLCMENLPSLMQTLVVAPLENAESKVSREGVK